MNRLEHSAGSDTFGSRFKEIVSLATPASVAMLSYTMVGVVDTLLMGRIGASAMAGVGLANTLLFTLSALMMGLIGAVEPLAAQFEGAGRRAEAGRFLHQATWLALIGGLLLGLPLSLGAHTLLSWMNPIDDVVAAGSGYLQVRALGLPLFYLTIVRDHFLQGLGDTRTPMRVSIIINVLHVFLDLWFIFGGLGLPALGPAGAALSTCLSHGMSWVIYRWILRERHRREPAYGLSPLQPPDLERIGQMVKVGWPMSIQFFLDVGSWMLLTVLIGWMGANALAANQITIRIMSVTFMAVHGVSITATSLVGRHLGAGRPDEARRYGWTAVCVGIALMGVIGSTYLLVPGLWIGVFTDDPEVSSIASTLLKMGLLFQLTDTVAMVLFGVLKGAGDTRFTMYTAAGSAWLIGLPLGYLLAFPLGMGAEGVYLALVAQTAVLAGFNVWRVLGDRWLLTGLVTPMLDASRALEDGEGALERPAAAAALGPVPEVAPAT